MMRPDKERIRNALASVTEAEREWRAAWGDHVPALDTSASEIGSALATARQLLDNLAR